MKEYRINTWQLERSKKKKEWKEKKYGKKGERKKLSAEQIQEFRKRRHLRKQIKAGGGEKQGGETAILKKKSKYQKIKSEKEKERLLEHFRENVSIVIKPVPVSHLVMIKE